MKGPLLSINNWDPVDYIVIKPVVTKFPEVSYPHVAVEPKIRAREDSAHGAATTPFTLKSQGLLVQVNVPIIAGN